MDETFDRFMGESDGVMWAIERDPLLRSTITAVAVLEAAPPWEELVHRVDRATRLIPRLRQRVVEVPFSLAPPRWVVDPDFDLDAHVHRVQAPPPGDLASVLELASSWASGGFDRIRPLWEFTLVEGLEGGRAALVQKLHHSITDGVGAVHLATLLYSFEQDDPRPELPPEPDPERLSTWDLLRDAAAFTGGEVAAASRGVAVAAWHGAGRVLREPAAAASEATTLARSMGRVLAPMTRTLSPVMQDRSPTWRYDALVFPMESMKAAAHAHDCTLNDAFVAGLAGGMRRYHDRHGVVAGELRMTMPVSYRTDADPLGGNRIMPARFAVPVDVRDPAARMRSIAELCHAWREEPALPLTNALAAVLDHLPEAVTTSLFGSMLKHVDFLSTNVPGLPVRTFLAGTPVERMFAFAPPMGASVNVALLSGVGECCVGVTTDRAAVPDADVLLECLREGWDEVLAIATPDARVTVSG